MIRYFHWYKEYTPKTAEETTDGHPRGGWRVAPSDLGDVQSGDPEYTMDPTAMGTL
jgi:hypothetical protein